MSASQGNGESKTGRLSYNQRMMFEEAKEYLNRVGGASALDNLMLNVAQNAGAGGIPGIQAPAAAPAPAVPNANVAPVAFVQGYGPPVFNGSRSENAEEWTNRYRMASTANAWDDAHAINRLGMYMQGAAGAVWHEAVSYCDENEL